MIKVLQEKNTLPIARAQMRVRITMPAKDGKRLKQQVLVLVSKVEDDDWGDDWELVRSLLLDYLSFKVAHSCHSINRSL